MIPPPLIYIACGLQGTTTNVVIGGTPRQYEQGAGRLTLYDSTPRLYSEPSKRVRLYQ